jgi:3-oxoadipate enol-lactonase
MAVKHVEVGSGVNLHCFVFNNSASEALLLIHGWAGSSKIWLRYIKAIGQSRKIIAIDLKGFGDSDKPKSGYGLPQLADEAYNAAKKLGVSKAVVMGHSMGGQVAMYMAIRHKSFVKKLIIVDSAEKPSKLVPIWLGEAKKDYKALLKSVVPSLFDKISNKELSIFLNEALKMNRDSVTGTLNAIMKIKLSQKLKDIKCPTLLIFGIHDKNRSIEELRALAKKLNGSKLVIVKRSKHCPMYENVKDFKDVVDNFI